MGVVAPGIGTIERELTGALGAWATGSVAVGIALAYLGKRTHQPVVEGFARQQIGWGAIDGAIAAIGWARSRGQAPDGLAIVTDDDRPSDDDDARAARLQRILAVNATLDVVYVVAGAALTAAHEPLAQRSGRDRQEIVGDGLGIVVQGGFLLALDLFFLRRVRGFRAFGAPGPRHAARDVRGSARASTARG
jgi:hypothetical protein